MGKLLIAIVLSMTVGALLYWQRADMPAMARKSNAALVAAQSASLPKSEVDIGGKVSFTVDVARTDAEREQGLSGRLSMAADQGMLFIFQVPDTHAFWMKDMHFPLDIIWFDKDGMLIHVEHNLAPETYPDAFGPSSPDLYVLEINAGIAAKNGLTIGDHLTIGTQTAR